MRTMLPAVLFAFALLAILQPTGAVTNVTACGQTINVTGEIYVLNQSISSSGTCLTISNSSIVLDCAGFNITYAQTVTGNGVSASTANNVTIKNCQLKAQNQTFGNNEAIRLAATNNSLVTNNSIQTNGTENNTGIRIIGPSNNNTVSNNAINTSGSGVSNFGIEFFGSNLMGIVTGNTIHTGGTNNNHGIQLFGPNDNNTVSNNTIKANGTGGSNFGINVVDGVSNNFTGNNIHTSGTTNNVGLALHTGSNLFNIVSNNTINTNGTSGDNAGIEIEGVNNTIISNTINTRGTTFNFGVRIVAGSASNTVTSNSIQTNCTAGFNFGISISTATANHVNSNTIVTNGTTDNYGTALLSGSVANSMTGNNISTGGGAISHGVFIDSSNNNTFDSNQITTVGASSYGVLIAFSNNSAFNNTFLSNPTLWMINGAANAVNNSFTNTNFTNTNGSIRIPGTFMLNGVNDITPLVLFIGSGGVVALDHTLIPALQQTANIVLQGLTLASTPTIKRFENFSTNAATIITNGTTCSAGTCSAISYNPSTGVFSFTTNNFSSYALQGPVFQVGVGVGVGPPGVEIIINPPYTPPVYVITPTPTPTPVPTPTPTPSPTITATPTPTPTPALQQLVVQLGPRQPGALQLLVLSNGVPVRDSSCSLTDGGNKASGSTDAQGSLTLAAATGNYTLTCTKTGFLPAILQVSLPSFACSYNLLGLALPCDLPWILLGLAMVAAITIYLLSRRKQPASPAAIDQIVIPTRPASPAAPEPPSPVQEPPAPPVPPIPPAAPPVAVAVILLTTLLAAGLLLQSPHQGPITAHLLQVGNTLFNSSNQLSFGILGPGQNFSTENGAGIIVQNNGTGPVDIFISGGNLFETSQAPSTALEFKATGLSEDAIGETSQQSYVPVQPTAVRAIAALSNTPGKNIARIDIRGTIPANEPIGDRNAIITLTSR